MKLKDLFKKKEVENGKISLTFKMPLINFVNNFKSSHSWSINFNDEELEKIIKAIKGARKGKSQNLIFEDELNIEELLWRKSKNDK